MGQLAIALESLGWDYGDNVAVEIAGTSVYEIDGAGTKWAPLKGTRKYNKDAFIVIKNLDRNPTVPSQPNPDLKAHHANLDMSIGWEQHLKNGNLWRGEVELTMQGGETDEQLIYTVEVFVVSPTQQLAQYIITTMYPEYESVFIDDEPVGIPA